jgi:hypothetical protein
MWFAFIVGVGIGGMVGILLMGLLSMAREGYPDADCSECPLTRRAEP